MKQARHRKERTVKCHFYAESGKGENTEAEREQWLPREGDGGTGRGGSKGTKLQLRPMTKSRELMCGTQDDDGYHAVPSTAHPLLDYSDRFTMNIYAKLCFTPQVHILSVKNKDTHVKHARGNEECCLVTGHHGTGLSVPELKPSSFA